MANSPHNLQTGIDSHLCYWMHGPPLQAADLKGALGHPPLEQSPSLDLAHRSCYPLALLITLPAGDICDASRVYLLSLLALNVHVLSLSFLLVMIPLLSLTSVFPNG